MLVAGSHAHSLTGRTQAPVSANDGVPATNLWVYHIFKPLQDKRIVGVYSGCTACHFFAVDVQGVLYAWGRNERGQLGLRDTVNRYIPTVVPGLPPVVAVAVGKSHTLVACAGGEVFAAGDNSRGQCGVGRGTEVSGGMFSSFARCSGLPAVDVGSSACIAAGAEFSLALAGGTVFAAGSHQYGQCANGKTGEHIVSAGKVGWGESISFAPVVGGSVAGQTFTMVAAGANHGVALSAKGVPFTWGHGAYGRLGHGTPADVLSPTPIKAFESEIRVRCVCVCMCVGARARACCPPPPPPPLLLPAALAHTVTFHSARFSLTFPI